MDLPFIFSMLVCFSLLRAQGVVGGAKKNMTYGFVSIPLNSSHFDIQRPYNLPKSSRYSFAKGIHKLWVLSNDNAYASTSQSAPRTEISIRGYDYSASVWQFQGYVFVPSGTSGVCVMQVYSADRMVSVAKLRVYNGALMDHGSTILQDDMYNKWLQINVIHDLHEKHIKVLVNGELKLVQPAQVGASHYFKFGVYAQEHSSFFMEAKWKDIRVFMKLSD